MRGIVKNMSAPGGERVAEYMATCFQQRVGIRIALVNFASAARTAIDGESADIAVSSPALPLAVDCKQELSLLVTAVAEQCGVHESQIDPGSTLADQGVDSIAIVNLAVILRRHGLHLESTWFFNHLHNSLAEIAGLMSASAHERA